MLSVAIALAAGLAAIPARAAGIGEGLAQALDAIPPDRVTTGILYDRVLGLSRIDAHDGGPRAEPASRSEWRQMYHEIRRASLAAPAWPRLADVDARARALGSDGALPVAIMNFRYDRIRADAFESGALAVEGGRLALGAGDALETRRVFAAAALRERTHRGAGVVFRFAREGYYTNDGAAPAALRVDFDDGRGFVATPLDGDAAVRYAATGRRTVRLRLALADGSELAASFPLDVASLGTPTPDDTLHVTASVPYLGQAGSGEAYVALAPGHAAITNPVIVVEGFDLDNTMNWDELYALLNREQLLENLRGLGFDAVVLNFTNATDYVQRNGLVVAALVEQVGSMIDPQMSIALVGASMGGLAGRYALAFLESQAVDHRVRTFISFDSPQAGANIPLGIQYWVAFFADDAQAAADLLAALDSPAARAMLVYHHTEPPGATGQSDPLRAALLADLAALGGYPGAPRRVAIANGSGAQMGQGFAPGAQVVEWEYDTLLLDIVGNVWAVPSASSATIFHGLVHVLFTTPDERIVAVGGTNPYDNAPGGSRASMADMDSTPAPFGDIVALHPSHCFIPTVSALDLATSDPFYDIANDPDILALSPFDAVYFPQANQEHVLITPENAAWVTSEIQSGATAVAPPAPSAVGALALSLASPNPAAGAVRLRFALPRPGRAHLAAFDASGRRVAAIASAELPAGEHEAVWDVARSGGALGPGVYFVRLATDGGALTERVVLLR